MADAAVEFLLENVTQVLLNHAHLIGGAKQAVEKLERQLGSFKLFLRRTVKKRRNNESIENLVREIREIVYDAEDIIDAFLVQAANPKSKSFFDKAFNKPGRLHSIANDVEALNRKIKETFGDLSLMELAGVGMNSIDDPPEVFEIATVERQENVVGLDDEAKTIIGYLKEETTKLDPIFITGMPGLGKTTLTNKVFHDKKIRYLFPVRIWVNVTQEFTRKNVFLNILKGFVTTLTDNMRQLSELDLADLVKKQIEAGNFLIVLDDVWTCQDWDKLKIAFPNHKDVKMAKVLITSRNKDVAGHANPRRKPHELRLLTPDDGWSLLQYRIYGKLNAFLPGLDVYGKLIVKNCGNLPLAIVVIGGILFQRGREETIASKNEWETVSKSVPAYLSGDPAKHMVKIMALSYDQLPYHLRACFLYLGIFPKGFEIPAEKLTGMWIAEGFIQQQDGISSEKIAEIYLNDLINRNLVRVHKTKRDGKVKTCRLHDMLCEFCRSEARVENFLEELKKVGEGFSPGKIEKCRRLCIHEDVMGFLSSSPYGPRVRSFVCLSSDEVHLPAENVSAIPAAFKLLRVLEVQPIKFPKLPSDFYELVHLRYIVISFGLAILPKVFEKLWNVQTLIVETSSRTLDVKADIWKMMHLTHFKTNASATLPKPSKTSKEGDKIQTLGTISPHCCNQNKVFDQARNLRKLGIRGDLALIFHQKTGSFDSLGKMRSLEKLKLMNDVHPRPASDGKLDSLPSADQFPPKLRMLTLSKTHLDWKHMKILGELDNLEVLKLEDKAFTGDIWEVVDGVFRCLQFLYLERLDFVLWTASGHNFPTLRSLELKNCENLQEIPLGLAEIPTFKILDLHLTEKAAPNARAISDAKTKKREDNKAAEFKLLIFPPDGK